MSIKQKREDAMQPGVGRCSVQGGVKGGCEVKSPIWLQEGFLHVWLLWASRTA